MSVNKPTPPVDELMTPSEVARAFRVDPKTVTRWAIAQRMTSIRTPGGHRRYRRSEVEALIAGSTTTRSDNLPQPAPRTQVPAPRPPVVVPPPVIAADMVVAPATDMPSIAQ